MYRGCNHALKTNILLENRTIQHFLRRLGKCILPQLTVPDVNYRQCQNAARIFFNLLASHLPFRVMLQMSDEVPEETEVS